MYVCLHMCVCMCVRLSCSVMSESLRPHGQGSLPGSPVHGDSLGENTGMGCHALLQGIFPSQGWNPGLPHCRRILYHLSHQGSPPWGLRETGDDIADGF